MGLWTEYILVQGYISSLQSAETEYTDWNCINHNDRLKHTKRCASSSWSVLGVSSEVVSNLSLTGWQGASRCRSALYRQEKKQNKKTTIRVGEHLTSDSLLWFTNRQMSCNITHPGLKCDLWGKEHYQPAGLGLQLLVLWNRNHMRGVFRSIKTNTQRLNHD